MPIDTSGFSFQKPSAQEQRVTLTKKEKKALRKRFFYEQKGICGCGCGRRMTMDLGCMNTAELEHHTPNKMRCKKNDSPENLFSVWRSDCNSRKGSRRDF